MDRQRFLLTEYETCQSHINSLGYQYWISVGVFMAINTALLGGLLYGVLQSGISKPQPQIIAPGVILVILGIGMICILRCLIIWLKRTNSNIQVFYERMREIERDLGMWRGWLIHGLDHPECEKGIEGFNSRKIDREMQSKLINYHPLEWWKNWRASRLYEPPRGFDMVKSIFLIMIAIWTTLVLAMIGVLLTLSCDLIGMFTILVGLVLLVGIGFLYFLYLKEAIRSKP